MKNEEAEGMKAKNCEWKLLNQAADAILTRFLRRSFISKTPIRTALWKAQPDTADSVWGIGACPETIESACVLAIASNGDDIHRRPTKVVSRRIQRLGR